MIIQDTIIKADGTVEVREIEVADNYFDPPSPPVMTLEESILDKLTELEYRQDIIALGLEGGTTI